MPKGSFFSVARLYQDVVLSDLSGEQFFIQFQQATAILEAVSQKLSVEALKHHILRLRECRSAFPDVSLPKGCEQAFVSLLLGAARRLKAHKDIDSRVLLFGFARDYLTKTRSKPNTETLEADGGYALACLDKLDLDQAQEAYEEILGLNLVVLRKHCLDKNDTMGVRNNLAWIHYLRGNYQEALSILFTHLDMFKRSPPPDSTAKKLLACVRNQLAVTSTAVGLFEHAIRHAKEAVAEQEKMDPCSADCQRYKTNFASALIGRGGPGDYEKAEQMLQQIVQAFDHDTKSPLAMDAKLRLGFLYLETDQDHTKFRAAGTTFKEVTDWAAKSFGPDDPYSLGAREGLALTRLRDPDSERDGCLKAELEAIAGIRKDRQGPGHLDTLRVLESIAKLVAKSEPLEAAHIRDGRTRLQNILQQEHSNLQWARSRLKSIHGLSAEHPAISRTLLSLAESYIIRIGSADTGLAELAELAEMRLDEARTGLSWLGESHAYTRWERDLRSQLNA